MSDSSDSDGKHEVEQPDEHKGGSKGEVEAKLEEFIDKCFEECKVGQEKCERISRVRCAQLFYQMMDGHNYGEAWDDNKFKDLYESFNPNDPQEGEPLGLNR